MNYNVKLSQIYLFFLCVIAIFSCRQTQRPDVSNINADIQIQRFDQDLKAGRAQNPSLNRENLSKKYGVFYNDYIHEVIGNTQLTDIEVLTNLYQSQGYSDLMKEVDSVYPKLENVEKDLNQTFKYIKYYYPDIVLPKVISFVSGFTYQIIQGDNYIGVGLDMFLGKNSKFYDAITASVPRYQSRRFEKPYIVPRVTETFIREELFRERDEDQTLLAKMIYNGKLLYFMDQVLPEHVNDTLKIGYTAQQLNWCKNYEANIWGVFLERELLYQSNLQDIQTYLTDGPFTPGLGDKNFSAPKLGVWVGWQIVKKYMAENPEVSLQDLMKETDSQKVLNNSRYKPRLIH